ncbi:MAG: Mth938-like domain-containing protein [Alphaproteobacteria bacterium]|nr:Mth938-like domain-containing protein [Alphaproteobacteria bacterium]
MTGDKPRVSVQAIEAYGDGRFRISGAVFEGSVIVMADASLPWPARKLAEATPDQFAALIDAGPQIEILLLGCGTRMGEVPEFLTTACRGLGIAVEPMDTGAAARTYNLLASEGRLVAAALIAVD